MPWIEVPPPAGTWVSTEGLTGSWGEQSFGAFEEDVFEAADFDTGAPDWINATSSNWNPQ